MIYDLLLICLIVSLIHSSGFVEAMDEYVNGRFRFHHLPHIMLCGLCTVWWLSLLYLIVVGKLSLLNIALCLINAHLFDIMMPLIRTVKNALLLIVEWINRMMGY